MNFCTNTRNTRRSTLVLTSMCVLLSAFQSMGQANSKFEPRYHSLYLTARTNWTANATNSTAAWEFSRATFDLAEFATNGTKRAQLAVEGIDAARAAIRLNEQSAAANYYLAMNLGQLARTKLLGALKLVGEMEKHFTLAAALDPSFDYGGPDRNLGVLYREAPGWPASIGSRAKAKVHLKKAVELVPAYPANHLELLQAQIDWKENRAAEKMLPVVEGCIAAAKAEFAGENWEWAWDDWSQLWERLQARVRKNSK